MPAAPIRADVAVMGGGLAGLSASIGFVRRGRRVVVLERDPPGHAAGDPDSVFDGWERPGVAHFRQPHNFLGLGRRTLLDEAPDVLERVVASGAFENRQYELLPGDPEPGSSSRETRRRARVSVRRGRSYSASSPTHPTSHVAWP